MSRYKLQLKYPGSSKIGTEVYKIPSIKGYFYKELSSEITYSREEIEDYPNHWQLVAEKDYEILKFICKEKRGVENVGTILTKQPDGSFWIYPHWTEEAMLRLSHYAIYSVKRLSDGEIFTIGDKLDGWGVTTSISLFRIEDNILKVGLREVGVVLLGACKHKKTPLFTTEDGVPKFDEDMCYYVTPTTISIGYGKIVAGGEFKLALARFHNQEKAKIWVEENKPQFSKKDMIEFGWKVANECTFEVEVRDCFNRYIKK